MIAFLAPLIAAAAPYVAKGVAGLFKKKDKNKDGDNDAKADKSDKKALDSEKPANATEIINSVVDRVLSKTSDSESTSENSENEDAVKGKAKIPLKDVGGVVEKIVDSVMSKLNADKKEGEPTLSRSYASTANTRLQKAPLATLDKTPIPPTAPFLPKGAAALPPLGNVTRL
jgi:hypothetical protein